MLKITAELKEKGKGLADLSKATNYLKNHQAMVGIPEGGGSHKGINNAQLLFIHTNGSPKRSIPARPVIEPAIEQSDVQQQIASMLGEAITATLDGNTGGVESSLDKAGQYGENAVKAYFTGANGWAPNKPATIKRKGSSRPLIDTGALRQAITHVVKEI